MALELIARVGNVPSLDNACRRSLKGKGKIKMKKNNWKRPNNIRAISISKALVAVTIAAFAISENAMANGPDRKSAPVVKTTNGAVKGFTEKGVTRFYGIPYAAAPIGNLRWRPPVDPKPWKHTLDATKFGPECAQISLLGVFAGPPNNNEDCLVLNVYAPENAKNGKKLPVIFWIHGGGYTAGTGNIYDGSKLASDGQTVVVTINYRLHLLGFLGHPAFKKENKLYGNYTTLDTIHALKWVRDNISKFGGDPKNVTVGGQSAGANATAALVISPLAKGLLHRAIFQSSASLSTGIPLSVAEEKAIAFAVAAGCGNGADEQTAKCLRDLPIEKIMQLSGTQVAAGPYGTPGMIDGLIVPSGGSDAFSSGKFNRMPIMVGGTKDEGTFFVGYPLYWTDTTITEANVIDYVNRVYSGNAGPGGTPPRYPDGTSQRILDSYPASQYSSPTMWRSAIQTDAFVCRIQRVTHLLAGKVPLYAFEFQDRTAPYYFPDEPEFEPLASHTSDIQYLFPGWHGGDKGIPHDLNAQQKLLSDKLVRAWTNFAWSGDPNTRHKKQRWLTHVGWNNQRDVWPMYTERSINSNRKSYLGENIPAMSTFSDLEFTAAHKCDLWNSFLVY